VGAGPRAPIVSIQSFCSCVVAATAANATIFRTWLTGRLNEPQPARFEQHVVGDIRVQRFARRCHNHNHNHTTVSQSVSQSVSQTTEAVSAARTQPHRAPAPCAGFR
jgi:hypothetical protein